ncbi:hypothetical protein [Clostridium chrysemydis]|nr:hypothetical protein [Clostridium chrysemydis]
MKINLSFKESELNLYLHCKKKLSASIYIKELIMKDMEGKNYGKER